MVTISKRLCPIMTVGNGGANLNPKSRFTLQLEVIKNSRTRVALNQSRRTRGCTY